MSRQKSKTGTATLISVLCHSIEEKELGGHFRTAANYRSSMNKLASYLGGRFHTFTFAELTSDRVKGYAEWLSALHPDSPGTAEFYFRNLRAMCRSYREEQHLAWTEKADPFTGISFRSQPTSKRALSPELLSRLFCPRLREKLDRSRRESLDVLHFIFFMRGMVFQDIWNLRHDMIDRDGHIRYRRSKTGIAIDVEITPEARAIIKRYFREDSPYVFPFLHQKKEGNGKKRKKEETAGQRETQERMKETEDKEEKGELSEQSALRRVNRHATEIGELAGLCTPLTTYVLRHTWATLMLEAGYPVELIGQCLGHTSVATTHIYLSRISSGRVDTAVNEMFNRLVRPFAKMKNGPSGPPNRQAYKRKDKPSGKKDNGRRHGKTVNPPLLKGNKGYVRPKKNKACPFLVKKGTRLMNNIACTLFSGANITFFSITM